MKPNLDTGRAVAWVTAKLKGHVGIPLIATNRINDPAQAEAILADPELVNKAAEDRPWDINTCIACNQACLDHIFAGKMSSCLVNPFACRETEWVVSRTASPKSAAATLAERGHKVTLFDARAEIGDQFTLARPIPGKEVFGETLRYFRSRHRACQGGGLCRCDRRPRQNRRDGRRDRCRRYRLRCGRIADPCAGRDLSGPVGQRRRLSRPRWPGSA